MHRRLTMGIMMMLLVGIADQSSKAWILQAMDGAERTIPVTGFFNLVLVWNKGVTFGFFSHNADSFAPYLLIAVAALILVLLGRWLWRTDSRLVALALGAIMGGAVGNIADRIRHGAVVDFLDFYYANHHWYAFNIADAAIVTGVALLMLDGMVRGK